VAKVLGVLCSATAALVLGFGATSAKASLLTGGACPASSQVFSQFGDFRWYFLGANGGLENGSNGWALSGGASVVSGNESYYVHSRSDSHSLSLPDGATATTPLMCMATSSTVLRFFDKGASVRVQVVERNLLGLVVGIVDVTSFDESSTWQPSPQVVNLNFLQGVVGVSSVQLRFTSLGGASSIDDVYVDPWGSSN
jgi:hypothetical protein